MFWGKPLQFQVKHIGILTLVCAAILVLLVQMLLVVCSDSQEVEKHVNETESRPRRNCIIRLDHKRELPYSYIASSITIFLVILDIPSSAVLLVGTSRKLRNHILPWLVINGFKMVLVTVAICIMVWCTYVHVEGGIQFYYGMTLYGGGLKRSLHYQWR